MLASRWSNRKNCPLYLIRFILNFIDMAAVKLTAIAGFVVLITLLEQTKPMEARRVTVVHIGTRIRKLIKKVDELKKEIASREQCERKKRFKRTLNIFYF